MPTRSVRALALSSTAMLAIGCAAFEVDPEQMPADHDVHATDDGSDEDEHGTEDGHAAQDGHTTGDDHATEDGHATGDDHATDDGHEHDHGEDAPPIDGAPEIEIVADAMRFEPARVELTAGEPVNLVLRSQDIFHDLIVDDAGFHIDAERGEQATGGLVLPDPGVYVAYCSVPGHRQAGMELEIVVE